MVEEMCFLKRWEWKKSHMQTVICGLRIKTGGFVYNHNFLILSDSGSLQVSEAL